MHWRAAIRVLVYLNATQTFSLHFKKLIAAIPVAFSDANWGGDLASRRSTSGVLVRLGGAPVIFKSKRQTSVALSSAEAEYMALALAAQEVQRIRHLLQEMKIGVTTATTIHVDNTSAIAMARSAGSTSRVKHIDLRVHFVLEHTESGDIDVKHVRSADQLADYLTKPIAMPSFADLERRSGITSAS